MRNRFNKRRCFVVSILLTLTGCGHISEDSLLQDEYREEPEIAHVALYIKHNGILAAGDMVVNATCTNVYGTHAGDWATNNISTTSGSTISLIAGKACSVTLISYNDGTQTYTAVGSNLVISISAAGSVTATSAALYTSGGSSPTLQWFAAPHTTGFSIVINYAINAVSATTSVNTTTLSTTTISLSDSAVIPAPSVSGVTITENFASNVFQYTLTATASGFTSCVYIDNSAGTYTPTSWPSVNSAFNAPGITSCPVFTPGSATTGNWNSYWKTNKKTLVIWANSVGGINAYTVANIGP